MLKLDECLIDYCKTNQVNVGTNSWVNGQALEMSLKRFFIKWGFVVETGSLKDYVSYQVYDYIKKTIYDPVNSLVDDFECSLVDREFIVHEPFGKSGKCDFLAFTEGYFIPISCKAHKKGKFRFNQGTPQGRIIMAHGDKGELYYSNGIDIDHPYKANLVVQEYRNKFRELTNEYNKILKNIIFMTMGKENYYHANVKLDHCLKQPIYP